VQKLILGQGDVAPPAQATLTDVAGNPLNLAGASVRFRMAEYRDRVVAVDAQAAVLQNTAVQATWGQVAYHWRQSDTAAPGLYLAWFVVDFGNGPQHFPPTNDWFVLINPAP
jgi:hypothetical protein